MDENSASKKRQIPNDLLRKARERQGWTHKDVANLIELPDSHTVGRWERGTSFPQPRYRRALCHIFGKSAEELGLLRQEPSEKAQPPLSDPVTKPVWTVPVVFTALIGREREVGSVCALLRRSDVRLVTLLGPGGVGKTRLSLQVAMEMRDDFVDGICFVPLAAVRDSSLVISHMARVPGIREIEAISVLDGVKNYLRDKHFLFILDNFEHIVDASPLVEDLLAVCPRLKVLVTSRAVLHLQVENEYTLHPLTLPDLKQFPALDTLIHLPSIALFVERARSILPDLAVTPENAHVLAEICVRLDGLPLAIELAAARIKLFPPQALLARLSQRLVILRSELRMLPERQQTLYATIKWSYDLLDEQEKRLFRQISVFRGGCTLEAVERLFGKGQMQTIDVINVISSLLDKSLLQQVERDSKQPRLMQLETIREYGLDCLRKKGELEVCQQAHATYYLKLVEEAEPHLKGAQQLVWMIRLEQELENLREALGWYIERQETELALRFCEAFGKFCGLKGYWSEEQHWLRVVLALPQPPEGLAIRARVLRRAGHLAYRLRDLVTARVLQEESVALSTSFGDKQNLAGALSSLGWILYRQGDVDSTSHLLRQSVAAARESGDRWSIANAIESLGRFMHLQGNIQEAHILLEESLVFARELGDRECLARILITLVSIEISQRQTERATTLAQEAFALAQELNAEPLTALALDCLGEIAMQQGDYQHARVLFEERMALAQKLGDRPASAVKQLRLGVIALKQGKISQASMLVQESLSFFMEQGDKANIAAALDILDEIKRMRGE